MPPTRGRPPDRGRRTLPPPTAGCRVARWEATAWKAWAGEEWVDLARARGRRAVCWGRRTSDEASTAGSTAISREHVAPASPDSERTARGGPAAIRRKTNRTTSDTPRSPVAPTAGAKPSMLLRAANGSPTDKPHNARSVVGYGDPCRDPVLFGWSERLRRSLRGRLSGPSRRGRGRPCQPGRGGRRDARDGRRRVP